MPPRSAGLLLFRRRDAVPVEILLAHPGGPYFAKRELDIWSVPKGLLEPGEEAFAAARREFEEETGLKPPHDEERYLDLGSVRYRSGKTVRVWAFEGDCDPSRLESNHFELEWPPRSGKRATFPEVDRFAFFALPDAPAHLLEAQKPLVGALEAALDQGPSAVSKTTST